MAWQRIAVTMRVVSDPAYGERRDAIAQDWIAYLQATGYEPVLLPNGLSDPVAYVRSLSVAGIILTGGNTAPANRDASSTCPERDRTELALIGQADKGGIPVLGVCRGMQMINVYFGGTVTANFAAVAKPQSQHVAAVHAVQLPVPGWARLAQSITMNVNSFHDDAVLLEDLAPGLVVTAMADQIVVEGIAHPSRPIAGIQWHPERTSPSATFDRLFIAAFMAGDVECVA